MFENLMLRTIKAGDMLIPYPSETSVKVIRIIKDHSKLQYIDSNWLRRYWEVTHNIILSKKYKIAVCQFTTNPYKDYYYPILIECVKKPIRQKGLAFQWKLARQQFLMRKGKGKISMGELMGIHPEDITKARESNFWRKK